MPNVLERLRDAAPDEARAVVGGLSPEALGTSLTELRARDAARAEASFPEFVQQAWPIIEPQVEYVHNWHIDVIGEHLVATLTGELTAILVTIPPRHMKSLLTTVLFPAWVWIKYPGVRFLCASYGHNLSMRDSVKMRRLIQSVWYQRNWGDRFKIMGDQNAKERYDNDKGGYRIATSVGGIATGEGADIIIIDDPHNILDVESEVMREEVHTWFTEVMSSRLNPGEPRLGHPRAFIVIQQRSHEDDLAGRIIRDRRYTHLCLPARYEADHPDLWPADPRTVEHEPLWEGLFPHEKLLELEAAYGGPDSYPVAGQLQQRPAPRTGGLFDRDDLLGAVYDDLPSRGRTIRFWDVASTAPNKRNRDPDWTVGTKGRITEGALYVINVVRFRGNPAKVDREIRATAEADGRGVEIVIEQEPGSSGKSVIHHYAQRLLPEYTVRGDRPSGSKEDRARPLSAWAERGCVRAPRGAPWLRDWVNELATFPRGRKKDQVDSATGLFNRLSEGGKRRVIKIRA